VAWAGYVRPRTSGPRPTRRGGAVPCPRRQWPASSWPRPAPSMGGWIRAPVVEFVPLWPRRAGPLVVREGSRGGLPWLLSRQCGGVCGSVSGGRGAGRWRGAQMMCSGGSAVLWWHDQPRLLCERAPAASWWCPWRRSCGGTSAAPRWRG
jgi:hypothetical protein